jgi:endonuclease/exonuclease/phosphatase family metal-dependent hydrolase
MVDTWLTAAEHRGSLYATWHGYRPLEPGGARIDWILTWGAVTTHAVGLNTAQHGGQFPSDHLPLQALLSFG